MSNFGPQYLTADGKFTSQRPKWMKPKGCETPDLSELEPKKSVNAPANKNHRESKLSEAAAQKIAEVLHIMMMNDKNRR
ncbi:hypothetical protein AGMMS49938_15960 [Fibrobacterales bacterium]|nr:hypothetical protein AGMMS49938_15960 [Fibrobacterales bacterium]